MGDDVIKQEMILDAKTENLDALLSALQTCLTQAGCPPDKQTELEICAEEIFVNIASYAFEEGGGKAYITVQTEPHAVSLCFRDKGVPYDPLEAKEPDTSLSAEERPIGGLGIFMVKTMMDCVSYEYKDGFNCLTMTMTWQNG